MSKLDEQMEKYMVENKKHKLGIDETFLRAVAKSCGPSIYKADSSKVSSTDPKELETVKKNFLIKKLGLKDTPKLDEGIAEVIKKFGKGNRNKYRPLVYALLASHFRKKSFFKPK
jgi:hypothetical protein